MQPYELSQPKYALWFDVGIRLGQRTQGLVANALCSGTHKVQSDSLITGEDQILRELASRRSVLLYIE